MFGLGIQEFAMIVVIGLLPGWLVARIAAKAGHSKLWGIPAALPLVHIVVIWALACAEEPNEIETRAPEVAVRSLRCPQCSADYDLADYRPDLTEIYCSSCGATLPR
jgi:hypothetical protein